MVSLDCIIFLALFCQKNEKFNNRVVPMKKKFPNSEKTPLFCQGISHQVQYLSVRSCVLFPRPSTMSLLSVGQGQICIKKKKISMKYMKETRDRYLKETYRRSNQQLVFGVVQMVQDSKNP